MEKQSINRGTSTVDLSKPYLQRPSTLRQTISSGRRISEGIAAAVIERSQDVPSEKALGQFIQREHSTRNNQQVLKRILTKNPTDRKVIKLDRGEGTTVTIQTQGCVVSSWRVHNIEQLFTPVTADYNQFVRFKGGITLSFPHDPPCEIKEIYELCRLYVWSVFLEPKYTSKGDVTATFVMMDDLWTRSSWDHPFLLFYKLTLRERSLTCDLRVVNTSPDKPLEFKIHLQMNFQVKDLDEWRLSGLHNEHYSDKLATNVPYYNVVRTEECELINYGKTMYRIYTPLYEETPLYFLKKRDECEVRRKGLKPFKPIVKISKTNLPDVTIRYPWYIPERHTDGVKAKHLITDAKRDAVCVGTGHISKQKKLKPGEMYRTVTKISILPEERTTMTMAELVEPALFRKPSTSSKARPHQTVGFDMGEFCKDSDQCKTSNQLRWNAVPNSGTYGFGWWSLVHENN